MRPEPAPQTKTFLPGSRSADQRRLRELDSLRGIAAVCVLLFHLSYHTDPHRQFPAVPMTSVVVNLTMVQALARVTYVDPSYWTLTVELVFYLLLGAWFKFRGPGRSDIETYAIGWMLAATDTRAG